jgi:hypothetical protein
MQVDDQLEGAARQDPLARVRGRVAQRPQVLDEAVERGTRMIGAVLQGVARPSTLAPGTGVANGGISARHGGVRYLVIAEGTAGA